MPVWWHSGPSGASCWISRLALRTGRPVLYLFYQSFQVATPTNCVVSIPIDLEVIDHAPPDVLRSSHEIAGGGFIDSSGKGSRAAR
jgi:hypothetical protein